MYDVKRLQKIIKRVNLDGKRLKTVSRPRLTRWNWHKWLLELIMWFLTILITKKVAKWEIKSTNQTRKSRNDRGTVDLSKIYDSMEEALQDVMVKQDGVIVGALVEMDTLLDVIYKQQNVKWSKGLPWFKELKIPLVVPEFRGLSIAGLISGCGLESSSWKYGGFAEGDQLKWMEGVTVDGEYWKSLGGDEVSSAVLGTMGTIMYVTRAELKMMKVWSDGNELKSPFVDVKVKRVKIFDLISTLQDDLDKGDFDYIDGVVLNSVYSVIIIGRLVGLTRTEIDEKRVVSFTEPTDEYYISHLQGITEAEHRFYTPLSSYLFRWDRCAYWCGLEVFSDLKSLGIPVSPSFPLARRFLDPLMDSRGLYTLLQQGSTVEDWILQDFYVPISKLPEFFDKIMHGKNALAMYPLWLCPIKQSNAPFCPSNLEEMGVNVGVYGIPLRNHPDSSEDSLENTKLWIQELENLCAKVGGKKMLHGRTYSLWNQYDRQSYQRLKQKYDENDKLATLEQKVLWQ